MSIHRTRRINARTAENLLNGVSVDPVHHRLAAILRAAAGPTQPGELAGRQQALTAFQRARQQPVHVPRRRSMMRTALLKLATVKAAVVAAVVVGTGGIALAATAGAVPNPLRNHATPTASTSYPGGRPSAQQHAGDADPSPSLVGLCHAYIAGAGSEHGKALDNPAFQALLTAAGGKANVDAFCAKLLATAQASEAPTDHPDARPTDHPTGRPSEHPGSKPSTHPSH